MHRQQRGWWQEKGQRRLHVRGLIVVVVVVVVVGNPSTTFMGM